LFVTLQHLSHQNVFIDAPPSKPNESDMPAFEIESSLQPVSPEQPCGPDLQYDADFIALESAAQGKPEQQYGETIIPAESPAWQEVKRLSLLLLSRTKDLRAVCHLSRALAEMEGFTGFSEGLALTRGYVELYWEEVHPLLDPEDDNDPTERVNIISSLADKLTTVAQLLRTPLVHSPVFGAFSIHDVQIARGETPPKGDDPPPDMAEIEAAFMDCDLDSLRETIAAVEQGCDDAVTIEAVVTQHVGVANAVSLEVLTDSLKTIGNYLQDKLRLREGQQQAEGAAGSEAAEPGAALSQGSADIAAISGEIRSREDVIRTLDKICEYYDRHEPSSPLPILLRRAKRLVTKGFMDILEDLAPDGVSQARLIEGENQTGGDE
jgi:type VI secretion system protein ImpA